MIDALVSGRLAADPKTGTSRNGSAYVTARVLVTTADEERLSVSVIAFSARVVDGLMAMGAGEPVTLSGELTPKVWTDREGNAQPTADLKAHAFLTPYHVSRRRKTVQQGESEPGEGD
ncbi:single-stranded DNA-binding protein [Luteimonas sp. YGD11-2]|uniref:single-stranded DNA-binding protein n=1 Tax=Luteimonas sp. YGD11-2 TaxID=2508168 RepID=UPI00100BDBCA|nr:single-stranded DNA-binding protein [Luteimonas sp. YGD11-2]